MRRPALIALLVASLCATSCGDPITGFKTMLSTPQASETKIVQIAADSIDAANKLAEVVEQTRAKMHKLHQLAPTVVPREVDDAVQHAAIAFADGKDVAVSAMGSATSAIQVVAAAAPLIGSANSVFAAAKALSTTSNLNIGGAAGLIAAQLPDLYKQGTSLVKTLGGK